MPFKETSMKTKITPLVQALVSALLPFASEHVAEDGLCHKGLCTKEECSRCSQILAARAAIEAARKEGCDVKLRWLQPKPAVEKPREPKIGLDPIVAVIGVLDMQVCVPATFTDEQIIEFANRA